MFTRRQLGKMIIGGAATMAAAPSLLSVANAAEEEGAILREDGQYTQSWFLDSFLDLSEDFEEARANGKRLAIIWEQKGCPYCRETHLVNFAQPKIRNYIRDHFEVVQMDIWGARETTDFQGNTMEERELARKAGVIFTPTIQFFPDTLDAVQGKSMRDAEVMRMPGYFKPFHFLTMFEYVYEQQYDKVGFQRYIQNKGDKMREEGKNVTIW